MDNSLVSIIVPVYNVEKYLEKCVETLVSQTYNNLEIVLVDDGATDSSGEICERLAETDNRIQVYHKTNSGLGLTRNYGMERSHGRYVVFVDSDDYLEKDIIEKLVTEAEKESADFVTCGYTKVTDEGDYIFTEKYNYEKITGKEIVSSLLARMIGSCPEKKDSIFTTVWCNLYDFDIIRENHLEFHSERELQSEDLVFEFDYLPHAKCALVLSDNGYFYRTNLNSLAMRYKENRFEELKKVYYYINSKISEMKLGKDAELRLSKMFFVQLRQVLKQEIPEISKKDRSDSIKRVREITGDELVRKVIKNYPVRKLSFKQRAYICMIKYNMAGILLAFLK